MFGLNNRDAIPRTGIAGKTIREALESCVSTTIDTCRERLDTFTQLKFGSLHDKCLKLCLSKILVRVAHGC